MSRAQLVEIAKKDLEHGKSGTLDQVDEIYRVPVEHYFEQSRWNAEMRKVFRRLPLMLATTSELPSLAKAGFIRVTLDPYSKLDINQFLSGYDEMLAEFGFAGWLHQHTQVVHGPNWKVGDGCGDGMNNRSRCPCPGG